MLCLPYHARYDTSVLASFLLFSFSVSCFLIVDISGASVNGARHLFTLA